MGDKRQLTETARRRRRCRLGGQPRKVKRVGGRRKRAERLQRLGAPRVSFPFDVPRSGAFYRLFSLSEGVELGEKSAPNWRGVGRAMIDFELTDSLSLACFLYPTAASDLAVALHLRQGCGMGIGDGDVSGLRTKKRKIRRKRRRRRYRM